MMIAPPELTEGLESVILDQLREGDKYSGEIAIPGFNNAFNPWHQEVKRRLLEQMETLQRVHRPWQGRTPGRWRIGAPASSS
jgi:hypothetical protein